MRNSYLILASCVMLTGCLGFKELPVEYDYSYKGNFKRYRTFDLMQSSALDTGAYKSMIEKSIVSRMKFLGYKQTVNKPHLLVCYKMFPDSLTFNGYVQPDIEQWVMNQEENIDYDPKKLEMKTGTLLIQLYDKRQNRSIWQGYTTALYSSINFNDQRNIRNAVISILDKYRFWADGFMEGTAYRPQEVND
jgi:hypothetical protein